MYGGSSDQCISHNAMEIDIAFKSLLLTQINGWGSSAHDALSVAVCEI